MMTTAKTTAEEEAPLDYAWTEKDVEALLIQVAGALPGMSLFVSGSQTRILDPAHYGPEKVMRWMPRYCTEKERKAVTVYALSKSKHRTDLKQTQFAKDFLGIDPSTLWRWRKAGVKKITHGLKRDGIARFRLVDVGRGHLTVQFTRPDAPNHKKA
jgi:hypothetical protein